MLQDCLRVCAVAIPVQKDRTKFKPPSYLYATHKDIFLLVTWCVNLLTKLCSKGLRGEQFVLVCIDTYTMWIEAFALVDKTASIITQCFHKHITCCFGVPSVVQSGRGTEFHGRFHHYLTSLGMTHSVIAMAHPRTNGIVERYNACIKGGLHRMLTTIQSQAWWEILPDVLAGLRFLPTHLGYSPFVLLYKQEPKWVEPLAGAKAAADI